VLKTIQTKLASLLTRPAKQRDPKDMLDHLVRVAKNEMSNFENPELYPIDTLNGPHQYVMKAINTKNLRMIRVEIPKITNQDQRISVFRLEREHDIIEHIDQFYKSQTEYIDDFNLLIQLVKYGHFFNDWFFENIDRSDDRNSAWAYLLPDIHAVPVGKPYVYYGIIRSITPIDTTDDNFIRLGIKFLHIEGSREVLIPVSKIKHHRKGNIFVVSGSGKTSAVQFSKARHYLEFKKSDWKDLVQHTV